MYIWKNGTLSHLLSRVVISLPGPVAGALSNRFGSRPVALVGAFLGTAGLLSTILTTQPWHLHLSFGLITGKMCYFDL